MRWLEIAVETGSDSVEDIRTIMNKWARPRVAVEQRQGEEFQGQQYRVTAYLRDGEELPSSRTELLTALWHVGQLGIEGARAPVERWADESEWQNKSMQGAELAVYIDPGMAFGTGLHRTTQQVLRAMQELLHSGDRVLDLGTGSGVLAIAAARLGAGVVIALDKDPQAIKEACANVTLNNVSDVVCTRTGSISVSDQSRESVCGFNLVVANIVASVHCGLAKAMAESLAPGGTLILGGIVQGREGEVISAFEEEGLEIIDQCDDSEWTCLTLRLDCQCRGL